MIFVGKKPLHAYVRAVVKAMEDGDREIQLVAVAPPSQERLTWLKCAVEGTATSPRLASNREHSAPIVRVGGG